MRPKLTSVVILTVCFVSAGLAASQSADEISLPKPVALEGHEKEVVSLAFSPDGKRLASGSLDNQVIVWDAVKGEYLSAFDCKYPVFGVALPSNTDRLYTGSWGGQVWDLTKNERAHHFESHSGFVRTLSLSPDEKAMATGALDGTVVLCDPIGLQEGKTLNHGEQLGVAVFSRDGKRLISAGDRFVKVWDVVSGRVQVTVKLEGGEALAVSPVVDEVAVATASNKVAIVNLATGEVLRTDNRGDEPLLCLAYSPNGKYLACGGKGGSVRIWPAVGAKPLAAVQASKGDIRALVWSAKGDRLAAAGDDKVIRLFDMSRLISHASHH